MKSPIEALMQEYGAPMTREEYLKWNNLGKSSKVSAEEEAELPKRFAYPVVTHEELPESAAKDKRSSGGAPADFGGRVIPNPKGVRPALDTENPEDTGMKMNNLPYYEGDFGMDTSNADAETLPEPTIPERRPVHVPEIREQ